MFSNIGDKIKTIACVMFGLETFAALIAGLISFIESFDSYGPSILMAFVYGIVGPILAYILACLVYGFGELIEKAQIIANNSEGTTQTEQTDVLPLL